MEESDPATVAIIFGTAIFAIPIAMWLISKCQSKSKSNINSERRTHAPCSSLTCNVSEFRARSDATTQRFTPRNEVGSKYNEWREPVFEVGLGDADISKYFQENNLHISESDWQESRQIMDKVVKIIAREMKTAAAIQFPGLVLEESLIKQGSSREGLKVCDPLEFDFILPFRIEGVRMVETKAFNCYGNPLPGLFKQRVVSHYNLPSWMMKHDLLKDCNGDRYINTSNFHRKVFTSLFDQSEVKLNQQFRSLTALSSDRCRVVRSVRPPTLKIRIKDNIELKRLGQYAVVLQSASGENVSRISVEADLVPGLCLSSDTVPDPYTVHDFHQCHKVESTISSDEQMPCERYGVMKYVNKGKSDIPESEREFFWRNSTCGYEKHILDVARRNQSQRYVMTACRLLKGALLEFQPNSTNQLGSVVNSYHLKNICFYCILFLTIPSKENTLSGVKEALGYFVKYLELSIEEGYLPHFFYGNPYINIMFLGSPFEKEVEAYNLFASKDPETMHQARYSLSRFLQPLSGLYMKEWMLDSDKIRVYRDLLLIHESRV
ncbi:uncharacterized protein LOC125659948 isoform X1 [Ostrea edulis]|uniref:uncharacterized protein LOC125659948 isoform X1 n=1 Tax=Ostrea edulis TaxID=37623 RepID=UPI0024AFA81F|nr:uncharacterized protein LOC125659948 isoform X1 [Ostrea edulis]